MFQGDSCVRMLTQVVGCDIMSTQTGLLIRSISGGNASPNLTKATDIIENAVLGLLGVEESKAKLLYDLTESYSEISPNGLIQMRNPMQSFERVWAGIIDIPSFINEEGRTKYSFAPFV